MKCCESNTSGKRKQLFKLSLFTRNKQSYNVVDFSKNSNVLCITSAGVAKIRHRVSSSPTSPFLILPPFLTTYQCIIHVGKPSWKVWHTISSRIITRGRNQFQVWHSLLSIESQSSKRTAGKWAIFWPICYQSVIFGTLQRIVKRVELL